MAACEGGKCNALNFSGYETGTGPKTMKLQVSNPEASSNSDWGFWFPRVANENNGSGTTDSTAGKKAVPFWRMIPSANWTDSEYEHEGRLEGEMAQKMVQGRN